MRLARMRAAVERAPLRTLLVAGLLIIAGGAAMTAWTVGRLVERALLDVDTKHIVEHVQAYARGHVGRHRDLRAGDPRVTYLTRDLGQAPGVFQVTILDAQGVVVASNEPSAVGRRIQTAGILDRALRGEVVAELTTAPASEPEHGPRRVRQVYVPIAAGGVPVGVAEVHLGAEALERAIHRMQFLIALVSVLSALGLYGLLAAAVWRASRALGRLHRRETSEVEARLAAVERLRAYGEIAAGAVHDLRNVFMAISGRIELVTRVPELPDGVRRSMGAAEQAIADGMEIMRRLREIGRPDDRQEFEAVYLNGVVEDVLRMTEPRWRKCVGVDVSTELEPGPPVLGRPGELREVVTNLVLNALDAMPEGGHLTIVTARRNGHARIEVSDTGIGMTPDVRDRLFVPFTTTKPNGTGLGLSVSYGIVKRHGGTIDVESLPGKGSRFVVRLPVMTTVPVDGGER